MSRGAVAGRDAGLPRIILRYFRQALQFPSLGVSSASPAMIATDNQAALDRFADDPLTVKDTRVAVVAGLLAMNGISKAAVARCCTAPTPFLCGARDKVTEQVPTVATLRRLPAAGGGRVGLYRQGWHILLRDRQRPVVAQDRMARPGLPGAGFRKDIIQ